MIRRLRWPVHTWVTLGAFVLAASLAGWSAARAVRLDVLPPIESAARAAEVVAFGPRAATPEPIARVAVDKDPFRAERRPPTERFRLPGEDAAPPERGTDARAMTLIGTAVLPEGRGFAMCQLPGEQPRLVRIGESIGTFTLTAVAPGRATFRATGGGSLEVRVPKAGT